VAIDADLAFDSLQELQRFLGLFGFVALVVLPQYRVVGRSTATAFTVVEPTSSPTRNRV